MLSRSHFLISSLEGLVLSAAIVLAPSKLVRARDSPHLARRIEDDERAECARSAGHFSLPRTGLRDNGMTSHEDNYIRIKVLTEEGRKYGDIEIRFNKGIEKIAHLQARTIEPDGSSVEFNGSPFDQTDHEVSGAEVSRENLHHA